MELQPYNLNYHVHVKLSDEAIHSYLANEYPRNHEMDIVWFKQRYKSPMKGHYRVQMWEFARNFGRYLGMGMQKDVIPAIYLENN